MIQVRLSNQRGYADHGWLKAYHTFSFADYYDPQQMGFSVLRVINEDRIEGGSGFPTHGHADMEIVTFVISGALEHKDSLGNTGLIRPGEIQRMSAGTGIRHSEFNSLKDETTHLLQIWILPDRKGHKPGYEQKSYTEKLKAKDFVLLASPEGRDDSVKINQDLQLYVGKFKEGEVFEYKMDKNRSYWLQIIKGESKVNGNVVKTSDGVAISHEQLLKMNITAESEFLLFDMPQD